MLKVSEAIVTAEKEWYQHAVMMDANLGVITGRHTRDESAALADDRLQIVKDAFGVDAIKLRDEWKARLEDPATPLRDPSPRAYLSRLRSCG